MTGREKAGRLLAGLEQAGYATYLVGGCVRDLLRGQPPHDYDIATSARPDEVKAALSFCRFADTGLRHGTVTAIYQGSPFEITTFRTEGPYSDRRRPDSVQYTADLTADLARRDFTVNAIAVDRRGAITDPFGGQSDLRRGVLRCVGDPVSRFSEDPLRILRGVRFYSRLGFRVEAGTDRAMRTLCGLLGEISCERVAAELTGILLGDGVQRALLDYPEILFSVIPELRPCWRFDQQTPWHAYDVYEHTARTVAAVPPQTELRLAALFHDIAKPQCFTLNAKGNGSFPDHAPAGAQLTGTILHRLHYPKAVIETVVFLVAHHSDRGEPTDRLVRRWAARYGAGRLLMLAELMLADDSSKAPAARGCSSGEARVLLEKTKELIASGEALRREQLAVNGHDLLEAGFAAGPSMGQLLDWLYARTAEGQLANEKAALLAAAREWAGAPEPSADDAGKAPEI